MKSHFVEDYGPMVSYDPANFTERVDEFLADYKPEDIISVGYFEKTYEGMGGLSIAQRALIVTR